MSSVSRTALFAKIHKVLKKHYKPISPPEDRPVLGHLLFACCLEDARYEAAEEAFAALENTFYDWNEVRVTSISELSEVMAVLPDPRLAANRLKRVLHGIFEELYDFNLEDKRKKNLGPTVKWLENLDGSSKFCVGYVVQAALGGHSIPIDTGTLALFRLFELVSDKEVAAGEVPGLERAIAKSKGVEFGSLVHQLAADYSANAFSPQVREIILQIDPDVEPRFPQRRAAKVETTGGAAAPATGPRGKKGEPAAKTPPVDTRHAADTKHAAEPKHDGKSEGKKGAKKESHAVAEISHEEPHRSEKGTKSTKTDKPAKAASHDKASPEKHSEKHTEKVSDKHTTKHASDKHVHDKHTPDKHTPEKHEAKSGKADKGGKRQAAADSTKEQPSSEGISKRKPR